MLKTKGEMPKRKGNGKDIYKEYRRCLKNPELTEKEIDEMRINMQLLARTICEHVWGEKFY